MYNIENGAAILREAAYTEGYKAGKNAVRSAGRDRRYLRQMCS